MIRGIRWPYLSDIMNILLRLCDHSAFSLLCSLLAHNRPHPVMFWLSAFLRCCQGSNPSLSAVTYHVDVCRSNDYFSELYFYNQNQGFDLAEATAVVRVRVRRSVIRVRISDTCVRIRIVVRAAQHTALGIFHLCLIHVSFTFYVLGAEGRHSLPALPYSVNSLSFSISPKKQRRPPRPAYEFVEA